LQKKWDKRVAVSNTHNITGNNKSILALDDEFDIAALEYLNSSTRDCSIVISDIIMQA
jgi:hypothetical protein